jgi:hypothetical protein
MRLIILALYIFWKCVIDYTFLSVSIHGSNVFIGISVYYWKCHKNLVNILSFKLS